MQIITSYEAVCLVIDELLARWRATPKRFPFNHPEAVIPQTIIPDWLRNNKEIFPNWYLWVDLHMKGRITSLDAFRGHIRIAERHPWFYLPHYMRWEAPARLIEVLEECQMTSDKINVVRDLRINAMHLETYYDGNAINLFKGATSWEEAVRRVKNKRTRRERRAAGHAGEGFYGHQEKMVSMQLYLQDWEGWLRPRFPYPAPSDIHNIRIALAARGIVVTGLNETVIRDHETITAPWREVVLRYIKDTKEDPIAVSDVLWLFSKLLCGNSPLTHTSKQERQRDSGMFDASALPHVKDIEQYTHPGYRRALEETCLVCPLLGTCDYAIPARPYYDRGLIELRPRPRVEDVINRRHLREPRYPAELAQPTLLLE